MVDNNLDINIITKADKSEVEDLSELIKNLKEDGSDIEVKVHAEDGDIDSTKKEIDDLQTDVQVDVAVDDGEIIGAGDSIDSLTTSVEAASNSSDSLNQGLNLDSSSLSDASNMAYELSKGVGDADQSTKELGNDLSLLEAGAMLDIANQLSQYGKAAENLSQDMNEASISVGQLSTQTGIAEPQMVSMINHISNATFPNEEAMMYVKSLDQIGVSGDNLGKSATDLDKINDAFGLGANTVNSMGQELSVLGVDMNNVSSSFNALAYANANTVGGMENYYSFLRKYDAQFNELGFNVDQASVIIAAATQKFGGGRAALTGLNNALKESNGDTRALEEALGLESGSIENATALTGQYEGQLQNLANEEMEHKSILDQLNAAWEDMSLFMSPVLAPLTSFLGLIGQAGSFAVGINGLVTLAQSMKTLELANIANTIATKASAAAQWLLNIAMDANPIMLVVLAIIALVAILGYLYFNNEQVRAAIDGLGQTFMWVGQIIYTSIVDSLNWIISSLQNFWNYIVTLGGSITGLTDNTVNNIINGIVGFLAWWFTLPAQIGIEFINIIAKALGFGNNFVQNIANAGINATSRFLSGLNGLLSGLQGELNNMLSAVVQWAATLPQKFWEAGVNAVKNFLSALGIASPGTMQRTLVWEISEMARRTPIEAKPLLSNISSMSEDVVDSFGAPGLDVGLSKISNSNIIDNFSNNIAAAGTGDTIINVYGDVDSDARVKQIVEAVRKELSWNNKTAGRSV